jgi:3-oxoacyl-[acyl-carrier-protein] synthase II
VLGYGTTADAHHIAAAPPDANGLQRCMQIALRSAGIAPDAVEYVNAHATSTALGDAAELTAIRHVFGEKAKLSVSSTKSSTGHLLGAAGATAGVFVIQALLHGVLPPTLNLRDLDPAAGGLHVIGGEPLQRAIACAMLNGFGFGGVNASLVMRAWSGA